MNRTKYLLAVSLPCLLAFAQVPTSVQAVTLVKQAVAFAKQNGVARLIEETNTSNGKFHVTKGGELYIFIYDERGITKAHGFEATVVGTNRWGLRDPDGVMIIQELMKVAKTQGRGWVDYKYLNPTTNVLDQKSSYCEFYDGMLIGCGIYKEQD
jgi:signal transduction histidine kinase